MAEATGWRVEELSASFDDLTLERLGEFQAGLDWFDSEEIRKASAK